MTTTAETTAQTILAPGERIIRVTRDTGETSDLTVPSWAARTLAAEKATQPDVLRTEVIGTDGGVEATFTAMVPLPGVTPLSTAEMAYLDALLFCTVCRCPHLPSAVCPGPCPEPECRAAAGESCADWCPSRFISYDEIGE